MDDSEENAPNDPSISATRFVDHFPNFLNETSTTGQDETCQQLSLTCLWEGCGIEMQSFNNWKSYRVFEQHILGHSCQKEQKDENSTEESQKFECMWYGCSWEVNKEESTVEYDYMVSKHLSEHAHHSRLMSLGCLYASHFSLPLCKAHSRYLPDHPQIFFCRWEHCEHSNHRFVCPLLYYAHVICHSDWVVSVPSDSKYVVSCLWEGCSQTFLTRSKLRVHLRGHTGEKRIACHICGCCFVSTTKFKEHLQRQSTSNNPNLYCDVCDRSFHSHTSYIQHMNFHSRPYNCSVCDFSAGTRGNLKKHYLFKHSSNRPFSCDYCDKSYKSSSDLNDHIKTHFYEKNIKPICSTASQRQYACHLCTRKYSRGYLVTLHLTSVHGIEKSSAKPNSFELNEDGLYYLKNEFR